MQSLLRSSIPSLKNGVGRRCLQPWLVRSTSLVQRIWASTYVSRDHTKYYLGRLNTPRRVQIRGIDEAPQDQSTTQIVCCYSQESLEEAIRSFPETIHQQLREDIDLNTAGANLLVYNPHTSSRVLLVSLGSLESKTESEKASSHSSTWTNVVHTVISALQNKGQEKCAWTLSSSLQEALGMTAEEVVETTTRVALLTGYKFDAHTTVDTAVEESKRKKEPKALMQLDILLNKEKHEIESLQKTAEIAERIANGTLLARDMGNERADVAHPGYMEYVANEMYTSLKESYGRKVSFESIVGVQELEKKGLRMLAAVGQGARWEPRLVTMTYNGREDSEEIDVALIGKGLTFDSGGLNLKPTGFMEDMHMDKCGACAVLSAFHTVATLGLKKNIVVSVVLAENAIDANSYKPHAILKSYKGLTVEVGNTDAEGRLCLVDGMAYVQEKYKPAAMIDLATLTGACVVALGEYAAGLFSNNKEISKVLQEVGDKCNERVWPMPILPEHTSELKATFADTRSIGAGRFGGACTAAAFLQKFVPSEVAWAHLDIAGPAMYSSARGYMPKGSTGFGVQLLVDYLRRE